MFSNKKIIYLILFFNSFIFAHEGSHNFWNTIKKGTNIFNRAISRKDIQDAKKYGVQFIRLAPDKFLTNNRDFLIGNADHYKGLDQKDLEKLKKILDMCYAEKIPVIITMLSLPGSRWRQNNHNQDDVRLWKNENFQNQAALFWKDLVRALKHHKAVVGYNILNEPHPERIFDTQSTNISALHQKYIQEKMNHFYQKVIQSIRSVDKETTIIVDSSAYGDPQTFQFLKPIHDKNIIYSFHMYEPYVYTNQKKNKDQFQYPGKIQKKFWDKKELENYMKYVKIFQTTYDIPSHKILVGEFGCHRMTKGIEHYFQDLVDIFKTEKWHFAFYAFREDTWDGMNYELGHKKLPWSYWKAIEKGKKPFMLRDKHSLSFNVLKKILDNKVL